MKETILVTGAGGFVGGTIVEALYFGQAYDVRAGIARWSSAPRIARLPISLTQCDILKPDELTAAFAGVDYVIHCAVGDDQVIVEGTKNVLQAAARAGVKRVVFISSVAVYGEASGSITETTQAPNGTVTAYGAAKIAAETLCLDDPVNDVVILRPTIIYGPFSARWTMLYALRLQSGLWRLGSGGDGKCNLVHVHDVAHFAIAAVRQTGIRSEIFNINGPEIITWDEYFERFNQSLGLPPLTVQPDRQRKLVTSALTPVRMLGKYALKHHKPRLRWLANKSDRLKRALQQIEFTLKCTPNPDELTLFALDSTYLADKSERAFGFKSAIGVEKGLVTSAAWLHHMGQVI